MNKYVVVLVILISSGISFTANAADIYTYPEIISEECTLTNTVPMQGTDIYKDWHLTMSDLRAYGSRGKVYMSDIDYIVNISSTTTETCVYEYDDGGIEEYSHTTYDGTVTNTDGGLISVSMYTDDVTGQVEVSVDLEVPDQFGDTVYIYGSLYMTRNGITGYVEGNLPTRDGTYVKMFGDMDIYEVSRKG